MLIDERDILLVEDNPADVELTMHALRHNELVDRIQLARDGEEALDYLFCRGAHRNRINGHPPKLVLLDLKLPKLDGHEVLRELKNHPGMRAIPVVVMTSSIEESDLVTSYKLGVNSYILKPVDFDRFRETVKQISHYWLSVNRPPPASLSYL